MSTRIEQQVDTSAFVMSSHESEMVESATSLAGAGSPEELIAMAMIMLDRNADQSREARREAQRAQHEAVRDQVDAMLEEADHAFYASMSGAVGQAVSGSMHVAASAAKLEAAQRSADATEVQALSTSEVKPDKYALEANGLRREAAQLEYSAGTQSAHAQIASALGEAEGGAHQRVAGRARAQQAAFADVAQGHGERAEELAEDARADERRGERALEVLEGIAQARAQAHMAAARG